MLLAVPMYYVERSGGRERLGVAGYVVFVGLYWTFQLVDRFRSPLTGALPVIVLSALYALAAPRWVHSRAATDANERAGGKGGIASLFHIAHSWPALPQPRRWADMGISL